MTMTTVSQPVDNDGDGKSENKDSGESAKATDDLPWTCSWPNVTKVEIRFFKKLGDYLVLLPKKVSGL